MERKRAAGQSPVDFVVEKQFTEMSTYIGSDDVD